MITGEIAEKAKIYIMERLCKGGGFCFYRLEEPNASDTYFAVLTLRHLGIDFRDDRTIAFLKNMQREDGSYSSIYSAYYSIMALKLMGEKPEHDCKNFLRRNLRVYDPNNMPAGLQSIFRQTLYALELCREMGISIDKRKKEKIADFVFSFKKPDHGFGRERSTLIETFHAVSILEHLDYSCNDSLEFLKNCENRIFGFVNIPGTYPSFLEYIYAGLVLSDRFLYLPRYMNAAKDFIIMCQNKNGGFSRSPGGFANLEYTYYAVRSLHLIEKKF